MIIERTVWTVIVFTMKKQTNGKFEKVKKSAINNMHRIING
jgi:hypothetical protein